MREEIRPDDTESLLKKTVSLAKMFELGGEPQALWDPAELGTILKHQLAAPLEFDVLGLGGDQLRELRARCSAPAEIRSFGDLLHHPRPPVELLELTKQFAKAGYGHSERPLPDEVAAVLYVASIVAALMRCGKRITRLGDEGIRFGVERALRQPWLDPSIRELLETGRRWLENNGPERA